MRTAYLPGCVRLCVSVYSIMVACACLCSCSCIGLHLHHCLRAHHADMCEIHATPYIHTRHNGHIVSARQLDITLRQLQVAETMAGKLKIERLVSLWERLYVASTRGQRHGRRWKYLIGRFKNKAVQSASPNQYVLRKKNKKKQKHAAGIANNLLLFENAERMPHRSNPYCLLRQLYLR